MDPEKNNQTKIKTIHTFSSDMADAVREQEATVIRIALAEKNKREMLSQTREEQRGLSNNIFYLIGGIILVGLSIWGVNFFIDQGKKQSAIEAPPTRVETIIKSDEQKLVDVTQITNKIDMIDLLQNETSEVIPENQIKAIILYETNTEGRRIITLADFFKKIDSQIPSSLLSSLDSNFMIGVHNIKNENKVFIVMQTNNYNQTFSGMIAWEPSILFDLFRVMNVNVSSGIQGIFETPWSDKIIENRDTRTLDIFQGQTALIYMFIDRNKILISTDQENIKEVIQRNITQASKPL
jgi:hypothetical protein